MIANFQLNAQLVYINAFTTVKFIYLSLTLYSLF